MKIFFTPSATHLAKGVKKGKAVFERFADGEIYVRINENVKNKNVWVVANTAPPAENLVELFLLLDALKRNKAKINLLLTYFGYARQDRAEKEGEAVSAEAVSGFIKQFKTEKIIVVHIHTPAIRKFLSYKNEMPVEIAQSLAKGFDFVVGADLGALEFAKKIAKKRNIPYFVIQKKRITGKKIRTMPVMQNLKGKKILLVDDMISTGDTIIGASEMLFEKGAREVSVFATHGVLSGDAIKRLNNSGIKNIYVTNTFYRKSKGKIKVVDASRWLGLLIKN